MASEDVQITSVIDANGQSLPLHGNSLGGPLGPPVKQERPDDAEIRELAAKMKEQQKQQAAQQASRQAAMQHSNGGAIAASSAGGNMQPPITNGNGQTNIRYVRVRVTLCLQINPECLCQRPIVSRSTSTSSRRA